MTATLTPARFIREHVFSVPTQKEFGDLLGYEQATISRFESGQPISRQAMQRIRDLARTRGVKWEDHWFWDVPPTPAPQAA